MARIEKLQNLSLKIIAQNLEIYQSILKKNNWKFPTKLADILFKYIYDNEYFNYNRLHFFAKDYTSLTKFIFVEHKTFYPDIELDKFSLKQVCFPKSHLELVRSVLEKFFIDIRCLTYLSLNRRFQFEDIHRSLLESSNTLQKICLNISTFNLHDTDNLSNVFEECSSLKEINLYSEKEYITMNCMKILNDKNQLTNFKLERIKMDFNEFCLHALLNLKKLETFCFNNCSVIKNPHCLFYEDVLSLVKKYEPSELISPLREIKLFNCDLKIDNYMLLGEVCCQSLNIETVEFDSLTNLHKGINFICDGLLNSCNKLQNISFVNGDIFEYETEDIKQFLTKCHNLKMVDFSQNPLGQGEQQILEGLRSSFDSLRDIKFGYCNIHPYTVAKLKEGKSIGDKLERFHGIAI